MSGTDQNPRRVGPDDPSIPQILSLISECFAFMEGRIDPPSSVHRLTQASIRQQATEGEIWTIGRPPHAVVFLTPKSDRLYLGKLAVSENKRGAGLARQLVTLAVRRAVVHGLPTLELQTRVELVENHIAFTRLGFVKTGETAHPGYYSPTSITMCKVVG